MTRPIVAFARGHRARRRASPSASRPRTWPSRPEPRRRPASPSSRPVADTRQPPSAGPTPSSEPTGSHGVPTPEPTPTRPTPTPKPTPKLVPAPLTGMPVTEAVAKRRVIAVMIDDQFARPPAVRARARRASSGRHRPRAASRATWRCSRTRIRSPSGPIRSSRLYFIAWASEWRAVYVHVGGSPQALALLRSAQGRGKVVYDADEMRYGGTIPLPDQDAVRAAQRVLGRQEDPRSLAKVVGAKPRTYTAAWQFAPDAPLEERPQGSKLAVPYLANRSATRTTARPTPGCARSPSRASRSTPRPRSGSPPRTSWSCSCASAPQRRVAQAPPRGEGHRQAARPGSRPTARRSRGRGRRRR